MNVEFGWFLPTMGDSEVIGPPTRPALDPATPYGAWVATLLSTLFVLLSLAY